MGAGGGATEIELSRQIAQWGETHAGLEQYSINKFAEALEVVPRVLAENSGVKPKEVIAKNWALKYAVNAACTILRVDQIIMAKRAGGPKPRDTSGGMDQDDD